MRVGVLTLLVVGLAFTLAGALHADTWKLFQIPEWEEQNVGGSGTWRREPLLTESWATAGTIHGSGNLIPDPYAVFNVQDSGGHIDRAVDTPFDYSSSLLLGHRFNDDGAATYYDIEYEQPTGRSTTGSLVLWSCLAIRILEDVGHTGHNQDPPAIHTPEPAGILAFFCGAAALSGFLRRARSRHRHRFP